MVTENALMVVLDMDEVCEIMLHGEFNPQDKATGAVLL
jgi:hypothetical protein